MAIKCIPDYGELIAVLKVIDTVIERYVANIAQHTDSVLPCSPSRPLPGRYCRMSEVID